jgi:hypothetical protein
MKPPRSRKVNHQVKCFELTYVAKLNETNTNKKGEIFPFRFLKRKSVFHHCITTLMDAFMHMIREMELNLKIYRTLNHERSIPKRKFHAYSRNNSAFN